MPFSSSQWIRRLAPALVIVLVAGALGVWSSRRQARQNREVHQLIVELCEDVSAGRNPAIVDPLISRPLVSTLQPFVEDATPLTITVRPADSDHPGATHTAMLSQDGRDILGLRVVHRNRIEDAVIIGFWLNPES